jgi:hypothetical protein
MLSHQREKTVMSAFSSDNVLKAIARVPSMSSKSLQELLRRADARGISDLSAAISAELALRGPVDLDAASAEQHARWTELSTDLDLTATISMAFRERPINRDELQLVQEVARAPGISHQTLTGLRGKGGVGLVIGHMVYERLGFFRRFLPDAPERMSDLIFHRDHGSGHVAYSLRPEAEDAFRELGLI